MNKKRLGVFAGVLFLMILLSGVISADTCRIVERTSCWRTFEHIVMGLSSATNAHGEFPDQGNYDYVLCCDFGTGDTTCRGTNKIIGLSSSTNAHAEIPTETNYLTDVCYEDLECVSTSGCDANYPIPMLSLSDWTNAHIGNYNDYGIKICCGPRCNLNSASWSHTTVVEGTLVNLNVQGTSCDGKTISFEVWEDDGILGHDPVTTNPVDVVFSGNSATGTWIAEWQADQSGDPEYYFITNVVGKSEQITSSDPLLTVTQTPPPCDLTLADWSTNNAVEGQSVFLNVQGTNCDGQTISFEVREDDLVGDDPVTTNPVNVVFSGNSATGTWIAEWQDDDGVIESNPPEYFFIARFGESEQIISSTSLEDELTVTQIPQAYCSNITICSDYFDDNNCENDICGVANNSVINVTCGQGYYCYCAWIGGVCSASWTANGSYCGNDIINAGETCDGIDWGTITNCSDFDEFTGGALACYLPGETNECHFDTSGCSPSNPGSCGDNVTNNNEECDDGDWGAITGCFNFDEFSGGDLSCDNNCMFNTSLCTGGPGNYPVGSCAYDEDTSGDDCEDGFLTYSWTATWTWSHEGWLTQSACEEEVGVDNCVYDSNTGRWYSDPNRISEECIDGEKTTPCPAQIKLPFFGFYNLIAAIALIALIYGLMLIRKKKEFK